MTLNALLAAKQNNIMHPKPTRLRERWMGQYVSDAALANIQCLSVEMPVEPYLGAEARVAPEGWELTR